MLELNLQKFSKCELKKLFEVFKTFVILYRCAIFKRLPRWRYRLNDVNIDAVFAVNQIFIFTVHSCTCRICSKGMKGAFKISVNEKHSRSCLFWTNKSNIFFAIPFLLSFEIQRTIQITRLRCKPQICENFVLLLAPTQQVLCSSMENKKFQLARNRDGIQE